MEYVTHVFGHPKKKNSQGLKNKNIKKFNGKPLIYWPIKAAKECKLIDYTIVTTDSNEIMNLSKKYGANAPFIRPKVLAKSTSKIYDVIIHTLNYLSNKNYILTILYYWSRPLP